MVYVVCDRWLGTIFPGERGGRLTFRQQPRKGRNQTYQGAWETEIRCGASSIKSIRRVGGTRT